MSDEPAAPLNAGQWEARQGQARDVSLTLERFCIRKKWAAEARISGDLEGAHRFEAAAVLTLRMLPTWLRDLPLPTPTRKERP